MKMIMDQDQVLRTLKRMSHEIIEKNSDLSQVILVGIKTKGTPVAHVIRDNLRAFEGVEVPVVEIDITGHRDDDKRLPTANTHLSVSFTGKIVILVDDVLFTGRSARAAMDAVMECGRASKIQLAALIDRGHRELPIRADYVGKNIPTSLEEHVLVNFEAKEVYIT